MSKTKTKHKKLFSSVAKLFDKKHEPLLHTIEWVFLLFAFFAVGFPILYFQSNQNLFGDGKLIRVGSENPKPPTEAEKKFIGETIEEPIDTTAWDTYRNQWYGFEIQHPDSWTNMQFKSATEKSARYDTIYKFRKNGESEGDAWSGFDVYVYSARKVGKLENTNNIRKKENAPEDADDCQYSEEVELGAGGEEKVFQKVSAGGDNPCFEPTYFFSIAKGSYIFNIVPVQREGEEGAYPDPEKEVSKNLPEFEEVVSSLKFIAISRPVVAPAKPRITAKRPVAAKVVGGKLVCAKKNDKPRKSKKNKPGHLDLECCLDPDERPNPWCSY